MTTDEESIMYHFGDNEKFYGGIKMNIQKFAIVPSKDALEYYTYEELERARIDAYTMLEYINGCVGVKGLIYLIDEKMRAIKQDGGLGLLK